MAAAKLAGIGGAVELSVGGHVDGMHGDPVAVTGSVRSLHDGRWVEYEPRHGGRRENDQGHTAVVELADGNLVVLNSLPHAAVQPGPADEPGHRPAGRRR